MASVCSCFLVETEREGSLITFAIGSPITCGLVHLPSDSNEEIREEDHHENVILVDGASWSIDVDTGESAKSTALGAATTGTGETTIVGGLKYSSNIGYFVQHFVAIDGIIQFRG
ncbi:hypothetical protein Tco_0210201 [Tanacetum coccineum]